MPAAERKKIFDSFWHFAERRWTMVEAKQISNAGLKRIAMCCMFLDHFGVVFLQPIILLTDSDAIALLYCLLRGIGRVAFPTYSLLLVEGILNTRNTRNYLLRLGICGLGSEIPYDLAFSGRVIDWHSQNVLFTLCLGFISVVLIIRLNGAKEDNVKRFAPVIASLGILMLAFLAEITCCDYGAVGVLFIVSMYLFRNQELWRTLIGGILLAALGLTEVAAAAAFPLLRRYSGKRGNQSKLGMYLFYPGHLLLLAMVRQNWGIIFSGMVLQEFGM